MTMKGQSIDLKGLYGLCGGFGNCTGHIINELGKTTLENSWSCRRKYEILGISGLKVTNGPNLDLLLTLHLRSYTQKLLR